MEMKKLLALYPQVVTFSSVIYAELIPVSQAHCITVASFLKLQGF